MKDQIESIVKSVFAAAIIAAIQAFESDIPHQWTEEPFWPVVIAILTYADSQVTKWANRE